MEPYRVNLDVYNGPLDLLLYLIRRDEVDIYDIPIAHLTGQYLQYVEMIKGLDPNFAAEFLVLAATLMEIKTRMLLPSETAEGEDGEEDLADPRTELVRQLLQYRAFKDAAGELRDAAEKQAMRHPRKPARPEFEPKQLELETVQVWDLFEAFQQVLSSIGATRRDHEVVYDDTPLSLHMTDLSDRLKREGSLTFRQAFAGRKNRSEIAGLFLAMLELIRQNLIVVQQERIHGEIYIFPADGSGTSDTQDTVEDDMIAFSAEHDQVVTDEQTNLDRELIVDAGAALARLDESPPQPPATSDQEEDWEDEEDLDFEDEEELDDDLEDDELDEFEDDDFDDDLAEDLDEFDDELD